MRLLAAALVACCAAPLCGAAKQKLKLTKQDPVGTPAKADPVAAPQAKPVMHNVEVEWEEHMECSACLTFVREIVAKRDLSLKEPNQASKFKLDVEREEWVIERALNAAATDYAFVVTSPEKRDKSRGQFMNIDELLAMPGNPNGAQEALRDLRGDPIYSLRTFLTSVLEDNDEDINGFISSSDTYKHLAGEVCYDSARPACGTEEDRKFGKDNPIKNRMKGKKLNPAGSKMAKGAEKRAAKVRRKKSGQKREEL